MQRPSCFQSFCSNKLNECNDTWHAFYRIGGPPNPPAHQWPAHHVPKLGQLVADSWPIADNCIPGMHNIQQWAAKVLYSGLL